MLDLFWQIFLPGQMTRIQEPDLLIDHDSGGGVGGCKRFLGGPVVEPFAFSGVSHMASSGGSSHKKIKSGGLSGKWFPFSSIPSPKKPCRTIKEGDAVCLSSSSSSSPSISPVVMEENPIVVVHNNNNIILDMMDENTRWSSSTSHHPHHPSISKYNHAPRILPPPAVVPSSNHSGLLSSTTKYSMNSNSNRNSSINSKVSKHSKNSNNHINNSNNKNNCNSISSNSSNNSSINSKSATTSRINNFNPNAVTTTSTGSHISSSGAHYHTNGDDEDPSARHLIIRYIHCNERPNKKQLVTLGLISIIFLIILVILLAMFLGPTSTRTLGGSNKSSSSGSSSSEFSDTLISSDITNSLNNDDVDEDNSDSYDEGDTPYYSSTTSSSSSTGLDLKKVSKLSWDLLNSNQDASSRGGSGAQSSSSRGASLPPLGRVKSSGDGEIIIPAKMIYTSLGDSADLNGGGSQSKKRSCCRTQRYTQVIKRGGCEPLTIVNKMCFGQCLSVWVPVVFNSSTVCRPSKSTFKTVTLTCGRNREKRKRVRIEKVRRCSCMEIEPTAAASL